ncbi:MAG: recombinase family protein [Bacillota bacterium]|nr:recombinase family protein [Bacillota bacterium]
MATAFAYARVSTNDQAIKDNSIPEQFSRIEKFAQEKGIEILRNYRDSDSAYHDENREQFKAMIADATEKKPDYILLDDSSRFARTRKASIETKDLLRRHGVNIVFVNEPMVDPKTGVMVRRYSRNKK